MIRRWTWLAPTLVVGLLACGQTTPKQDDGGQLPAPNTRGDFNGTVSFAPSAQSHADQTDQDIIPGQLIVKFKDGIRAQSISTLSVAGAHLERTRDLGLSGTGVYRTDAASAAQTSALARRLAARPDVEYAEPDRVVRAFLEPSGSNADPHYGPNQWNLKAATGGINMPNAWDVTTGSNSTVVAVVDTGILYRPGGTSTNHPDLPASRLLPGYDFISNSNCSTGTACSGDGDGRDADPYDPGDDPSAPSYHGTFVAGIVGATPNNRIGIAGVNWGTNILPVRVLGPNGGTYSDIIDGLLYSAGVAKAGLPHNPNPADVINLSLGGAGPCGTSLQNAINAALNGPKKPLIVVAAGNAGVNAETTFPANCQGVMTVGATDRNAVRTSYSNYGAALSVMAPGGGSGSGGVYSTTRTSDGRFTYAAGAGTSYAAPHVAAVAALMRTVNSSLSASQMKDLMERTARPVNCGGYDCGAGLIDANAALRAVPTTGDAFFVTPLSNVHVDPGGSGSVQVNIQRSNGFTGSVELTVDGLPQGVTHTFDVNPVSGTSSSTVLRLSVPASVAKGTYSFTVRGQSGTTAHSATVALQVAGSASVRNTFVDAAYVNPDDTFNDDLSKYTLINTDGTQANFQIPDRSPGRYFVYAMLDSNEDGMLNDGDYFAYSDRLLNPPVNGIQLQLEPVTSVAALKLSPSRLARVHATLQQRPRQD